MQLFRPIAPLASVLAIGFLPGLAPAAPAARDAAGLMSFLRQRLQVNEASSQGEQPTRVAVAWADLKGDGDEEALVYVTGDDHCGSGGCKLMVLEPKGTGFKVRASTSITWSPIGILAIRSHGWRDITVTYAGGGAIPGYVAVLRFDGTRYPGDPNPPAPRLPRGERPSILISDKDQGVPLSIKPPPAR